MRSAGGPAEAPLHYLSFSMKRSLIILASTFLAASVASSSGYKTFKGIPCDFHGASIAAINQNATLGSLVNHCRPTSRGYPNKRGQSVNVKRGTPVYAVSNMTLVRVLNKSAIKNCTAQTEAEERQGIGPNNCQQPYDAMELMFKDELGNVILYYHLMSENPFVPGFNKGECKIPELYKPLSEATRAERRKMLPRGCGGLHKTKVKKGELIGWSGATGKGAGREHFSFAIRVVSHPDFSGKQGWIIPSNALTWENYPTNDNLIYLLPLKEPSDSEKDSMGKVKISTDPKRRLTFCSSKNDLKSTTKVYESTKGCKEGHEKISYRFYLKQQNLSWVDYYGRDKD